MLPRAEYHLRLGIPNTDFDRYRHVPNRADYDDPRPYLGTMSNVLVGPVLRNPLPGSLRIPNVKLKIIGKNGQSTAMTWGAHSV